MTPFTLLFVVCILRCNGIAEASGPINDQKNNNQTSGRYDAIFSFGASKADTGNLKASQPEFPNGYGYTKLPYGMTYFGYPTGRFSDGRLVIDFIAQGIGLPLVPPYLSNPKDISHGVNFAVGGATATDASLLRKHGLSVPTNFSLGVQLEWFKKMLPSFCRGSYCKDRLKNCLFVVGEIGGNDINYSLAKRKPIKEIKAILQEAREVISSTIKSLIAEGAATVIVPGNLPIGCSTLYLSQSPPTIKKDSYGCLEPLNKLAEYENDLLQDELKRLRNLYPSANIIYIDYYNDAMEMYRAPKKLGFKEGALKTCCGAAGQGTYNFNPNSKCGNKDSKACHDPSQYVDWDGPHLTEAANKHIASRILQRIF